MSELYGISKTAVTVAAAVKKTVNAQAA